MKYFTLKILGISRHRASSSANIISLSMKGLELLQTKYHKQVGKTSGESRKFSKEFKMETHKCLNIEILYKLSLFLEFMPTYGNSRFMESHRVKFRELNAYITFSFPITCHTRLKIYVDTYDARIYIFIFKCS